MLSGSGHRFCYSSGLTQDWGTCRLRVSDFGWSFYEQV